MTTEAGISIGPGKIDLIIGGALLGITPCASPVRDTDVGEFDVLQIVSAHRDLGGTEVLGLDDGWLPR